MSDEGPTDVGSIIGYLIMDDSDWNAAIDRADVKAKELTRNSPHIRIDVDAATALAQLSAVRAAEDRVDDGNKKIKVSAQDANTQFRPLLTTLLALGPALGPLAVVGAAALGGMTLGAGSLFLAVKGVNAEIKAGTDLGHVYAAGVQSIAGDIASLEQSAARGVLGPFNDAVAEADKLMPALNSEVGQFATVTGTGAVSIVSAVVTGFITLRPLLQDVVLGFEHGASTIERWTSNSGGITKFMATAQVDMPIVTQDLLAILGAILKVGAAFSTTGLTALNVLGVTAKLINELPLPVLDKLAELVALSFAAWKGYQILQLAKTGYDAVTGAIAKTALGLNAEQLELRATAAAQASLEASTAALAAEQTAAGDAATAAALKEAGFGSAVEALAVSASSADAALIANAAASDAAAVAATAAADAEEAAGLAMNAALGPIGLVAAGIGLLAVAFMGSNDGGKKAKEIMDSYTAAVEADTGAIGKNITAKAAQNLQTSGADTAAQKLGISTATLLAATLGNADAQREVKAATDAATGSLNAQVLAQGAGRRGYSATSDALQEQRSAIDQVNEAVTGQANGISSAIDAYHQWNSALDGNQNALDRVAGSTATLSQRQTAIAAAYGLSESQAAQYLSISGYIADAHLTDAQNADRYAQSLHNVMTQEQAATGSAADLLAAMNTFAQSEDTIADKAKLLGAVLVASQGDALSYASALTAGYGADSALVSAFQAQANTLAQQSAQNSQAANTAAANVATARDKVTAANDRLTSSEAKLTQLQAGGTATAAQVASAVAAVASAKASADGAATALSNAGSAATAAGLAFADTELGAIDLNTGLINLKSAGAGPLIQQLQAMQSAAKGAAQAIFEHEVSTVGDSQALQDAQDLFESMTGGTLVQNAKQLGLTTDQAKKLADQYFGIPKDLTTNVQAVGLDTINRTLDQLGQQLAHLTGVPWVSVLTADTSGFTGPMNDAIKKMQTFWDTAAERDNGAATGAAAPLITNAQVTLNNKLSGQHLAAGGSMADGFGEVGENGPEWFFKSGANVQIVPQNDPTTMMKLLGGQGGVSAPAASSPASVAVRAASHDNPSANGKLGLGKTVILNQTINNPIMETVTTTKPKAMRRAALALDGL